VDYKDDPTWKRWSKAALQQVWLMTEDDENDDGTKATTTTRDGSDESEVVPRSMKKGRMVASAASVSSSQRSGWTGSSSSCQTYRTPASQRSFQPTHATTPTPRDCGVQRGDAYKEPGREMTQEQKAYLYDAYVMGSNKTEKGLGCVVPNPNQKGKTRQPAVPEEVEVPTDNEVLEDDGSSTLVSNLGCCDSVCECVLICVALKVIPGGIAGGTH
jgi:hypothetical protein